MKYRAVALLSFAVLLLAGCHRTHIPSDVIQPDTMAHFLSDAYLIDGFYAVESDFQYKEVKPQIQASYDSLLTKYHITADDFNRSIDYYTQHPDIFDTIHAHALRRLDKEYMAQ
jgi:hypothetical protein